MVGTVVVVVMRIGCVVDATIDVVVAVVVVVDAVVFEVVDGVFVAVDGIVVEAVDVGDMVELVSDTDGPVQKDKSI